MNAMQGRSSISNRSRGGRRSRSHFSSGQPRGRHGASGGASGSAGVYGSPVGSPQAQRERISWQNNESVEDGSPPVFSWLTYLWRMISILLTLLCVVGLCILLSILYVCIRPFSRRTYRRLACTVGAASFLDAVALLMPNVKLCLTGDSDLPSPIGTSLLVSNHVMEGDWWMLLMLSRCVGLRGSLKVFLRNEIPGRSRARGRSESFSALFADKDSHDTSTSNGNTHSSNTNTNNQSATMDSSPTSPTSRSRFLLEHHSHNHQNQSREDIQNVHRKNQGPIRSLVAFLLQTLLEFPSLWWSESSSSNMMDRNEQVQMRNQQLQLLRDFAQEEESYPVHLLLLPEGWSTEDEGWQEEHDLVQKRKQRIATAVEFAKREGRPQLKHLLLPRTTGFNASLESLRSSSPVVYDVTVAYIGYGTTVPVSILDLSWPTLWNLTSRRLPEQVHFRIKRYSMEEVLQDAQWLDKTWLEKDRALAHFFRHHQFPTDSSSRGFCRLRTFDTRWRNVEGSVVGLARLSLIPFCVPLLLLVAIPVAWLLFGLWVFWRCFKWVIPQETTAGQDGSLFSFLRGVMGFGGEEGEGNGHGGNGHRGGGNGANSADDDEDGNGGETTPYIPTTPFVSPLTMASPPSYGS